MQIFVRYFAVFGLTCLAFGWTGLQAAWAGDAPSSSAILKALKNRTITTRGFSAADIERETRAKLLINGLKGRSTRAITVEERTEVAKVVEETALPSIDLEILFAYDSAAIQPDSMPGLVNLGTALSDGELEGGTFLIAGHTDARGSDAYNQGLSERRADAVKGFLVESFGLPSKRLIAIGYGEEQLKLPNAPEDGENRRVQIVNLEAE